MNDNLDEIKWPNDVADIGGIDDDNKKGPEPEAKELYLEKDNPYNNDNNPEYPPMSGDLIWATPEEIHEMLEKEKKEMDRAQEEADLLPGIQIGDDDRGPSIDIQHGEDEKGPSIDIPNGSDDRGPSIGEQKQYYETLRSELLNEAYVQQEQEQEETVMTL